MSVEEARSLAASFRHTPATPPPRSIADVRRLLGDPRNIPVLCDEKREQRRAKEDKARATLTDFNRQYETFNRASTHAGISIVRLAERSFDLGNYQDAVQYLNTAKGIVPSMRVRRGMGSPRYRQGTGSGRKLVELMIHATLARVHAAAGDAERAEEELREVEKRYNAASKSHLFRTNARSYRLLAEGSAAQAAGELLLAEARFQELLATVHWSTMGATRVDLAWVGARLSANLIQQGRLLEAELIARETLRDAWRNYKWTEYMANVGLPATQLAIVLLEQGRLEDAEYVARMAVNFYEADCAEPGALPLALARRTLLQIRVAREDWRDALAVIEQGEQELADQPGAFKRLYANDPEVGLVFVLSGRESEGRRQLEELLGQSQHAYGGNSLEAAEVRGFLAIAEYRMGLADAALQSFTESVPILSAARRSGAAVGRPGSAARSRRVLETYGQFLGELSTGRAELAAGLDTVNEQLEVAQELRLGRVQEAYGAAAARAAARSPELAELVRRQQDAAQQRAAILEILNYLAMASSNQVDASLKNQLRARLREVSEAEAVLRTEIDNNFPDYRRLLRPAPLDIASIQSHLVDGEVLLAFQVTREKTFVWAIPRVGRASFAAVELGRDQLSARVQSLRRSLDPGPISLLEDIPPFDVAASHDLYRVLFAPVSDAWLTGKHLLVVADGALGQLPPAVVVTAPYARTMNTRPAFAEYRGVPWLARTHAITVLPAAAALPSLDRRDATAVPPRPFVGFGDPQFGGVRGATSTNVATRGGALGWRSTPATRRVDSAALVLLPPLPETVEELETIARELGADPSTDVFVGREATEARVKSMDLADRRIIAFATHGLLPRDIDGLTQPALAMSVPASTAIARGDDGLLTVDEILTLEMDADWVVLSACNTGAGDGRGAEAVSGLGRAFFYAGAHALLVSNWPVHSAATRDLMTTLFGIQSRRPDVGRSEALRLASLQLADEGVYRDAAGLALMAYAHPIFWAPFMVVGNGR